MPCAGVLNWLGTLSHFIKCTVVTCPNDPFQMYVYYALLGVEHVSTTSFE